MFLLFTLTKLTRKSLCCELKIAWPGLQVFVMRSRLIPVQMRERKQQSCSQTCNKPFICLKSQEFPSFSVQCSWEAFKALCSADKSRIAGPQCISFVTWPDYYCCIYAVWATLWDKNGWHFNLRYSTLTKQVKSDCKFLVIPFVLILFFGLSTSFKELLSTLYS